ncbi:hypothetical protein Tco_1514029 [Tanacetum coccineum]
MQSMSMLVKTQDHKVAKTIKTNKEKIYRSRNQRRSRKTMTKAQDQRLHSMKEQAYNIIKTKDSRTQRQSNLKKFKEARFKISPQEFKDHTLGEIVSLKYVYEHGSSESAGCLLKETSLRGRLLASR